MKSLYSIAVAAVLACTPVAQAAETAADVDLRRGVPAEAHLAIYGQHNPERDYQRAYYKEIWKTACDEKLLERFVEIITSRIPEEQLAQAEGFYEEIRTALSPMDWETLSRCQEVIYAQRFTSPTNQQLMLCRLPSGGAQQVEDSLRNLFRLVEKYTNGNVAVQTYAQGHAEVMTLGLPPQSPMVPVVARLDDVLLVASSQSLAHDSLALLQGRDGESKFDDPRLQGVLAQLPEAEDAVVFFDGAQMLSQMRTLGDFIREEGRRNGQANEKLDRIASLVELLFDELMVSDYEITVEYTEENRNRVAVAGRWLEGSEETLLGTMLIGGEPFEDWHSWIPQDAVAYSLTTGIQLHPFYERLTRLLREQIPESNEVLDKFEKFQEEIGVHLDRDILQSFSGECVSITLPATSATGETSHESVLALRCHKPEKIKGLLHRLVDTLNQFPAVAAQQLRFEPCDDLPEFERLHALIFGMFGAQPVIGFHDGWMMLGSDASAVQRVLDVRSGHSETIATSEQFQRFGLEIEGPVSSLSYSNLAEATRHTAQAIRQIGVIAPGIIAMIGAQADPEDLKPVQEVLALLPSVANVVERFDFLEERLTVVQPGDAPNTYHKQSVTLVRPPEEEISPGGG